MKCPACGFETPEAHGYCDFCKEPFRKKPEPAPAPKPQPKVVVPPAVMAKLMEVRAEAKGPAAVPAPAIPPEFAHLDPGERLAGPSEVVRYAAWAFLGLVTLSAIAIMVYAFERKGTPVRGAPGTHTSPPPPSAPPSPGLPGG